MAKITFKNENLAIKIENNKSLVEAIRMSGLSIETPCNGLGRCGKCRVKARGEISTLSNKNITGKYQEVLACTSIISGDAQIELLERTPLNTRDSASCVGINIDKYKNLGVAIDIGTTGISASLLDLDTGEIINEESSLNPQVQYGGDVLSRISYSIDNLTGKEDLKKVVINKINEILVKLVGASKYIEKIYKISVSANTVMIHMLLGLDTYGISRTPYQTKILKRLDISPKDLGIRINDKATITILPSVSAYIGADILSGAVVSGFDKKKCNSVFIDIGTNGELLAVSKDKIVGTSTAAGPAFEGMNISHGCRAESGAIDRFKIIGDKFKFSTIDDKKARGICGSGLMDIMSGLIENDVILKSGRFNDKLKGDLVLKIDDKKFYITEEIYISQKDIRQVQLAKAAISAGLTMLLEEINLSIEDLEEIIIAGTFGYHLNTKSIRTIGIIPKEFCGKVNFVGNSSLEGARLSLTDPDSLGQMIRLKDKIKVLDLSGEVKFQDYFVRAMSF